jgi:DNA-binding CsgD family transcriptional regulator
MALLEECRAEAVRMGDEFALAHAVYVIGLNALRNDDLPAATVLLEEAVARFLARGELNGVTVISRGFLAMAHTASGNVARAMQLCAETLEICAAHDDRWAKAHILYALAHAEWYRGDTRAAARHALESLRLKRVFDDLIGIAGDVELLGWIAATEGNNERAARLLGASARMWPEVGSLPLLGFRDLTEARASATEQARAVLGKAAFDRATDIGAQLDLDQLVAYSAGESRPKPVRKNGKATATALTKREQQIAELVADGMSNKEIAASLVISQRTAETHVEHILTKLGFTSRAQIAALVNEQRVT